MAAIEKEKALDVVRQMVEDGQISQEVAEKFFPELKESEKSEDEKIRKAIHIYLDWLDGRKDYSPRGEYTIRDMIAWVEKQGEHANFRNKIQIGDKVTRNEDGVLVNLSQLKRVAKKQGSQNLANFCRISKDEQKPADKVEPKFHKDDWIIHHGTENIYQVVAIIDNQYQLKYDDNYTTQYCEDVDRCTRLWDVAKDAKTGDVLHCWIDGDEFVLIYKGIKDGYITTYGHLYQKLKLFSEYPSAMFCRTIQGHFTPATKEQRDTLEKAMTDAGYTFDFEKKELKKIEQKSWSEEDEDYYDAIIAKLEVTQGDALLTDNQMEFLKSLKDRVLPQQQSHERNRLLVQLEEWLDEYVSDLTDVDTATLICSFTNYLDNKLPKSLKPKSRWKPSKEQIETLEAWLRDNRYKGDARYCYPIFDSLYEQLKKLREE